MESCLSLLIIFCLDLNTTFPLENLRQLLFQIIIKRVKKQPQKKKKKKIFLNFTDIEDVKKNSSLIVRNAIEITTYDKQEVLILKNFNPPLKQTKLN